MSDADGLLHLVFNGEIYNYLELRAELVCKGHKFVTETDSEVLLGLRLASRSEAGQGAKIVDARVGRASVNDLRKLVVR